MRLLIGTAILCAAVAAPVASAQRPIQQRQVYQRDVQRSGNTHANQPVVVRSLAGEALRITEFRNQPANRGRLADQYRGLYMNRQNAQMQNRRTLSTATPRAIVQRYPEGQFIRRGGQAFRVMPGRSISSF